MTMGVSLFWQNGLFIEALQTSTNNKVTKR